jgi:large subunit ribosomal protein L31
MKSGVHPTWHHDAVVTCSCGNTFVTGSMNDSITVDICSKCHPFFTGEMRFVDRQGRVDKFQQRLAAAQLKQKAKTAKQKKADETPAEADTVPTSTSPKSYHQVLQEERQRLKTAKAA